MATPRSDCALAHPALLTLAAALAGIARGQDPAGIPPKAVPFRAEVAAVLGTDALGLCDGRKVRLHGLSLPAAEVLPPGFADRLREHLRTRCEGKTLWVCPEDGAAAGLVALVREREDGPSINEAVLELGLAVYAGGTRDVPQADALLAAARRGQAARAGWFALAPRRAFVPGGKLPSLNGAVLCFYERDPGLGYRGRIDELAEMGFRHVQLLFAPMLDQVRGSRIEWRHPRTLADERLIDAITRAKMRGMSVMLMPILLLEKQAPDDWRGVIAPADEPAFWRGYDAMLGHYLDLAERSGVEIVSLGSELGSLETRADRWSRLIANARGRFTGLLTYSANWDHVRAVPWLADLDLIGMSAYFPLTRSKAPSVDDLEAGWRTVLGALKAKVGGLPRPVFFTELGYASQKGISTDPWNYFMAPERVDLQEQADCFEAFLRADPLDVVQGAYFFEYLPQGGPKDATYSPRGKPALKQWRDWASRGWVR